MAVALGLGEWDEPQCACAAAREARRVVRITIELMRLSDAKTVCARERPLTTMLAYMPLVAGRRLPASDPDVKDSNQRTRPIPNR